MTRVFFGALVLLLAPLAPTRAEQTGAVTVGMFGNANALIRALVRGLSNRVAAV